MLCPDQRTEIVNVLHDHHAPGEPVVLARCMGIKLLPFDSGGEGFPWAYHANGLAFYDDSRIGRLAAWYAFAACLLFRAWPAGEFTGGDVALCGIDLTCPPGALRGNIDDVCRRQPNAPRWLHELRRGQIGVGSGQIARVG